MCGASVTFVLRRHLEFGEVSALAEPLLPINRAFHVMNFDQNEQIEHSNPLAFAIAPPIPYLSAMGSETLQERLHAARKVCEQSGERFTPLREHVLELVIEDGGAVKAYDLLDRLKPDRGSPKPPTVYRALDFLSRIGLIHRIEALNAFIACDHSHEGNLAEFFICKDCSRVEERHAHDHADCKPKGFQISRSVIEHYGICATCLLATS